MAIISATSKVTLKIINNSYLLITITQILQTLPVEFPKDQYLLFLIYANDLCNILDPIMFATRRAAFLIKKTFTFQTPFAITRRFKRLSD